MERFRLATPKGEVSAAWHGAGADAPAMVTAHGAGAGMDHPFMVGFCEALAGEGVSALRMNFPYIEAGRRSPGAPASAIATVSAAVVEALSRTSGQVFAGGKSYGGRMASMAVAEGMACAGLVFLGYPLHPPGKPDQVRDEHLYTLGVPMLFLHGTKDPFATLDVLAPVLARLGKDAVDVAFEGAGHSFEVGRSGDARATGASLAPHVAAFVRDHTQMPRKNRRAPEVPLTSPSPVLRQHAPSWATADPGYDVREVAGDKGYVCPGCDHPIRVGLRHLVVVPVGDADARRHWHTKCWQSELRRSGHLRRSTDQP